MLDELQKRFLEFFVREQLHKQFYFTGGTALAEVYFHHRRSFDLDFFTSDHFDYEHLIALMARFAREERLKEPQTERKYDRRLFFFTNGQTLKVEFVRFEHPQLDERRLWNAYGILVDSLNDMAANKTLALLDRQEPKDVVDLYYLMTKGGVSQESLVILLKQKFGIDYKSFSLVGDLLSASRGIGELTPLLTAPNKEEEIQQIQSFVRDLADRVIPFPR